MFWSVMLFPAILSTHTQRQEVAKSDFDIWKAVKAMLFRNTNKNMLCIDQHISYKKPDSALYNFSADEFGPLIAGVKKKVGCFFYQHS